MTNDLERFHDEIFVQKTYGDAEKTDVVVDIGAHVGVFAQYMKDSADIIYCIEPSVKNFDELTKHTKGYKHVRCFNMAIAGENGECELYEGVSDGSYSILNNPSTHELAHKIPCRTLRQFIEDNEIEHIGCLKVDCEGAENEIINQGMIDLLPIIDKVVGEIHFGDFGAIELLKSNGYKVEMTGTNTFIARKDEIH